MPGNVQRQIPEHIFVPNGGYCVYYPSNIFRSSHSFENWGISLGKRFDNLLHSDIPQFQLGLFSQVTRFDQLRVCKNT